MTRRRLRDRVYRPIVARAITSPTGLVAGSAAAAALLAAGAPVGAAAATGLLAWALPVARAVLSGGRWRRKRPARADLPKRWASHLADADEALECYRRSIRRCAPGPLRDRLELLEEDFVESVERCADLARWGAEAEAARKELDPARIERAGRPAGEQARRVAADQREVMARLDTVTDEAHARLVLINGRLDEAVGRAVEMAGQAGHGSSVDRDLGSGEVASKLRALRAALDEVEGLDPEHRNHNRGRRFRRATSTE